MLYAMWLLSTRRGRRIYAFESHALSMKGVVDEQ
jgi:hypothetical protein